MWGEIEIWYTRSRTLSPIFSRYWDNGCWRLSSAWDSSISKPANLDSSNTSHRTRFCARQWTVFSGFWHIRIASDSWRTDYNRDGFNGSWWHSWQFSWSIFLNSWYIRSSSSTAWVTTLHLPYQRGARQWAMHIVRQSLGYSVDGHANHSVDQQAGVH